MMRAKVLLVDDDTTLLRFLSEYVGKHGVTADGNLSVEVLTARNGQDAMRLAYREQPDLVVLDVMMPGMDGWEVCTRLREMSDVPIILLTAKSTEADKLRGFRLGVDDYVTKPFSFAELTARILAILARIRHQPAPERNVVFFGDYVLDLDKRELRRNGELVQLTPTEYRLLEYLMRHRGMAVSEFDLMQAVWGDIRQDDTAAVRRYVWLLRQKIEEDPANPRWVLTVRGFGYRLETGGLHLPEDNP